MNRICRNCGLWGQAETGDWGSCCRLSYRDTVLSVGDGFVRTVPDFGCVEFVPLRQEEEPNVLVLAGPLYWEYDDIRIGGKDMGVAFAEKWSDLNGYEWQGAIRQMTPLPHRVAYRI
ncbi:MAG: hypothetical protein ACYSUV_21445 [Planctomycetota bacterium]|jgi:hypothetical protein